MRRNWNDRLTRVARFCAGMTLAIVVTPTLTAPSAMPGSVVPLSLQSSVWAAESIVETLEPPTLEEAGRLLQEEKFKEAAEAYRQIVEANPDSAIANFNYAYCTHMAGDLEKALELHKKAATFEEFRPVALYNIGCVYALTGKPDAAFEALGAAVESGFDDRNQFEEDSDLDSLKKDPRWEALFNPEVAAQLAQAEAIIIENLSPLQQMDFLKGEWQIAMGDQVVGRSKTKGILDGRALEESMEVTIDEQGNVMHAKSLLSYDEAEQKWKWTWVSNMGDHDLLVGAADGDTMVFRQDKLRNRPGVIGRGTYKNASKDAYQFTWETSSDDGATWTLELDLRYKRVF